MLSAEALPLKNIQPLATIFATEMTNLNVFGQTQLMLSQLKKKQQHYATLGIIAKQASERLEECIAALKEEKQNLIVQQRAWEEWNQEVKRKEELAAVERKEIAERKKNEAVAKLASQASGAKSKNQKQVEVSEKQREKQPLFRSYRTPSVQASDRSKSVDAPLPLLQTQSKKVSRPSSGYNFDLSTPEPDTDEEEYGKFKETEKDGQDMDDPMPSESHLEMDSVLGAED
jgi:hypothetical protein